MGSMGKWEDGDSLTRGNAPKRRHSPRVARLSMPLLSRMLLDTIKTKQSGMLSAQIVQN